MSIRMRLSSGVYYGAVIGEVGLWNIEQTLDGMILTVVKDVDILSLLESKKLPVKLLSKTFVETQLSPMGGPSPLQYVDTYFIQQTAPFPDAYLMKHRGLACTEWKPEQDVPHTYLETLFGMPFNDLVLTAAKFGAKTGIIENDLPKFTREQLIQIINAYTQAD